VGDRERQRRFDKSPVPLPAALLVALALHVCAVPLVVSLFKGPGHAPDKKVTKVKMVPMTGDGRIARPNMKSKEQIEREKEKEKEQLAEKKPDEPVLPKDLKGQIVDIPPTADSTAPKDAKYLSEHNTNVDKETVSRNQQQNYGNAMNELTVARKSEGVSSPQVGGNPDVIEIGPDAQRSTRAKDKKKQDAKAAQAPQLEFPRVAEQDRLALALDPRMGTLKNREAKEEIAGNGTKLRIAPGREGQEAQSDPGHAPKLGKAVADLVPTMGVLSRIAGAPAPDALDEQEGEGTFLKSREFVYAGFFNRMKKGVSQHWNPVGEFRRRDPNGNVYGQLTRTTMLQITLAKDGKLKDAVVMRSSGLDFLDAEAVNAFRRAEPFNNPPPALADGSGNITFQFGFTLEFRDGGGFRMPL
jgi:TonB family protein